MSESPSVIRQAVLRPLLLHGHDVDPSTLTPLAARLGAELLSGPLDTGGGRRAWFEAGGAAADACEFVRSSTPVAGRVLIGYSQGAALAFALACDGGPAPAAVVSVAGFVADDVDPTRYAARALLVVHSEDDEVVDSFFAGLLARNARRAGASVAEVTYEGGHVWNEAVTESVEQWIADLSTAEGREGREVPEVPDGPPVAWVALASDGPAVASVPGVPDALLVVSFGGPEGPADVVPFLRNVTRGRGIPDERLAEVGQHYRHFGGVSPINAQNRALIEALRPLIDLPIYWGNRNWDPFLADTLAAMHADGVTHAAAFLTSVFSSYSGCRQYLDDIDAARSAVGSSVRVERLPPFFDRPGFIEPMRDHVRAARALVPEGSRLVFTAHSIPLSMAATSRYEAELRVACTLVAEGESWDLVYQSRSGPPSAPWLGPDINDHLRSLAARTAPGVVVVPIGFVSDHIEVLWDLDTEAAATAAGLGLPMARAGTVGTDGRFVEMIASMVRDRLAGGPAFACPVGCCPAPAAPARSR